MSKAVITFVRTKNTPDGVFKHFLGSSTAKIPTRKYTAAEFLQAYPNSPFAGIGASVDVSYYELRVEFSCPAYRLYEIAELVCQPKARPRSNAALRMRVNFSASGKAHSMRVKQRSILDSREYRNWDDVKYQLDMLSPVPKKVIPKHDLMIQRLTSAAVAAGVMWTPQP